MEEVRANFASGSTGYDDRIKKIIPRYDEMLDALVSCVRPPRDRRLRIIDIGCGTGAVSARLLHSHPDIELTCLDMALYDNNITDGTGWSTVMWQTYRKERSCPHCGAKMQIVMGIISPEVRELFVEAKAKKGRQR